VVAVVQRSPDRIYTTHVGSLARPPALLDLMQAAAGGRPADPAQLAKAERSAVADVVARQRAAGLDVISDGEQSKTGFFAYAGQRLTGFEPRPGRGALDKFRAETDSFPEYYEQYFKTAMTGGMAAPAVPVGCTGPVSYAGHERLRRDLDNLRAAVGDTDPDQVFVCAVAPSGVGANEYYPSEADYLNAVADAMHVEYAAIIDAGFTLQIDDPFLTDVFSYDRALRRARGPGKRGRQRRLRLLLPGHLHPGDPPPDRVGQVRGPGRGSAPGHRPAVVTAAPRRPGPRPPSAILGRWSLPLSPCRRPPPCRKTSRKAA
jgi:Cobalamin-independent synthase, Catalytic domain